MNLILAAWRRIQIAYFRFCLQAIVEEREAYQAAGVQLGPAYLANSYQQAQDLRCRIAILETGVRC